MSASFQTFDDTESPAQGVERIPRLRAELARRGVAGFVVPRADEHQSEYVPANAERLRWLTGFTGSAGTAIVLADTAALVVDGRYTLQAAQQVETSLFTVTPLAETTVEAWIEANLPAGATLGYDPWLHTAAAVDKLRRAAERAGGSLAALDQNPIDAVWPDRPAPPRAPVVLRADDVSGESVAAKLTRTRERIAADRVDALLISDPHNLAWVFNLRGGDVSHTPLALGYALLPAEGRPTLFMDPEKITNEVGDVLGALTDLAGPDALGPALDRLGREGRKVRVDASTVASSLSERVTAAGGAADPGVDPITSLKAAKNAAEIAGTRAAHLRDGAAVTRYLHWLHAHAETGGVTEIRAVEALERFRRETGALKDVAFPTISGSGPNGAIVHYRVTRATDRALRAGELFLVDSGAQYEDGTTDVTRTVSVGEPSDEMRDRYTRVLKGHIAVATATVPKGSSGAQIDGFARRPLWEAGLDFDHGTGHGVGVYLSVHEGPQRISKLGHAALEPGMIVSNEPGYYKTGEYGIRLENLLLVETREVPGGERPMLGFETLTLAPFDRTLIATTLLTPDETAWLDAYHARVAHEIAPLVDEATRDWLENVTRPLV